MGIKSVISSPDSNFLSISSCDEKIRIINGLTFGLIGELEHKSNLKSYKDLIIYNEEEKED